MLQSDCVHHTSMDSCRNEGNLKKRFCNVSEIIPPESLEELQKQLHEIFNSDQVNVEYVQALMASYKSNRKEWGRYAKFDDHRYTRNLVDAGNGKFNLIVLCWNEAQASSIHDHANSHCFMKVLDGKLDEVLFEWPKGEEKELEERCKNEYMTEQCAYICDEIGLHRVENPSFTDKAVSLHLYSPPFMECACFDQRTGHKVISQVTFWSQYGERSPWRPPLLSTPSGSAVVKQPTCGDALENN